MYVEWKKVVRGNAGLPRQTTGVLLPGLASNENCLSYHKCRFSMLSRPFVKKQQHCDLLSLHQSIFAVRVLRHNQVYIVSKYQKRLAGPSMAGDISNEGSRFMSWCTPGMDWHRSTFSNLRISHWCLNS